MFGPYLQGFIGKLLVVIGLFMSLPTGCLLLVGWGGGEDGLGAAFVAGWALTFVGGYLDYLSKQTIRIGSNLDKNDETTNLQQKGLTDGGPIYSGSRDTSDMDYQLYLTEKYNIKRNDTLNVYVIGQKSFKSLDDAISSAHEQDTEAETQE